MEFLPNILKLNNGSLVNTKEDAITRRQEILEILQKYEYGYTPKFTGVVKGDVTETIDKTCSGHAVLENITLSFDTPNGLFSVPVQFFYCKDKKPRPTFCFINFRPDTYDMYYPTEEIIDNGFNIIKVYYNDITSDDGDFTTGIAKMYPRTNGGSEWGKIGMWAFTMSRIIDYLFTREEVDKDNIATIGHSRLGKTSLWCGAQDERVKYIISNDSGCSGAAYDREKHEKAETIKIITGAFPYWFCPNYLKYRESNKDMPFDQHFLLGACAPRYVLVGSASLDLWADPINEQLSCIGSSPLWKFYGKQGFIGSNPPVQVGNSFNEGDIHYHLRDGVHYLGRADWNYYMNFIKSKI